MIFSSDLMNGSPLLKISSDLIGVILILAIVLVALVVAPIIYFITSPRGKGWIGEMYVKLVIGKTKPGVRYVINDCRLRTSEGKTAQIDHILVNKSGVFVIETKNYAGRIYGQENQREWTQVLSFGRVKNKLYNPVKQNRTHVYDVLNIIGKGAPVVSAVVFVQGNIQYIGAEGVYTLVGLHKLINGRNENLTAEQMQEIYTRLSEANDKTIKDSEHIQNIRRLQDNISNNICPRCGKSLVVRNGKNGSFMGCEGYPSCRFTKKL